MPFLPVASTINLVMLADDADVGVRLVARPRAHPGGFETG